MAASLRSQLSALQKVRPFLNIRRISTSKNNRDTATAVAGEVCKKSETMPKKNWISYGWDRKDEQQDRLYMHLSFFLSISVCLVGGAWLWMYAPDTGFKDWAQREAFIELRRREKQGLPLIDPDLVPALDISLPSDDELGETEIII